MTHCIYIVQKNIRVDLGHPTDEHVQMSTDHKDPTKSEYSVLTKPRNSHDIATTRVDLYSRNIYVSCRPCRSALRKLVRIDYTDARKQSMLPGDTVI